MFHVKTIFEHIHFDGHVTAQTVQLHCGDGTAQVILARALDLARYENRTFDGLYDLYVELANKEPSYDDPVVKGMYPLEARLQQLETKITMWESRLEKSGSAEARRNTWELLVEKARILREAYEGTEWVANLIAPETERKTVQAPPVQAPSGQGSSGQDSVDVVHTITMDERVLVPVAERMIGRCPGKISYRFGSGPVQTYSAPLPPPSHPAGPAVQVGVSAIVCRGPTDVVLVGKRKGAHGAGKWALPGGHLEMWEDWADCASRELEEETGLKVKNFRFVHVTNDKMHEDGKHYITIFMLGVYDGADAPQLLEPDRCEGWQWVRWSEIPEPRFVPLQNILASPFRLEHVA